MKLLSDDSGLHENKCVIRLRTTFWHNDLGIHSQKSLMFLKRKCVGHNTIKEECSDIDADYVFNFIENINEVQDGVYEVIVCNIIKSQLINSRVVR